MEATLDTIRNPKRLSRKRLGRKSEIDGSAAFKKRMKL